jgi:hypothetical protein
MKRRFIDHSPGNAARVAKGNGKQRAIRPFEVSAHQTPTPAESFRFSETCWCAEIGFPAVI